MQLCEIGHDAAHVHAVAISPLAQVSRALVEASVQESLSVNRRTLRALLS